MHGWLVGATVQYKAWLEEKPFSLFIMIIINATDYKFEIEYNILIRFALDHIPNCITMIWFNPHPLQLVFFFVT